MTKDPPIYFNNPIIRSNFAYFFENLQLFKNKNIQILHLGAYTGHGTRWMLERVFGNCVDVDTWTGSTSIDGHLDNHDFFYSPIIEELYDQTVAGLPTKKFKGTTRDFFNQNKEKFDFIYIDASHKKEDVALDLSESWKILKAGGVIACDDYLWLTDGDPWNEPTEQIHLIPHEAINEFIDIHKQEIKILINNYQLWFQKT